MKPSKFKEAQIELKKPTRNDIT